MCAGIWLLANWIRSVLRKEGISKMNKVGRIAIVIALVVAVVVVIAIKQNKSDQGTTETREATRQTQAKDMADQPVGTGLPALVDLGAKKCIPCKLMAPILEELKTEYAETFDVEFIDVWENPKAGKEYGVRLIPTQIFYNSSGKELFRHEGFFSKEDILTKWKELGVELTKTK